MTSSETLHVVGARLPHDQFFAPEQVLDLTLRPGEDATLAFDVRCTAAPGGAEIENAFLILRADPWRVFARLRVRVGADGVPAVTVERVDVQRVGGD